MKKFIRILLVVVILIATAVFGINTYVIRSVDDKIITVSEASELEDVDCILVLGCLVKEEGIPSHMLEDRLLTAIAVYERGNIPKILMSGDHGTDEYDEVNTMKKFAIDKGIESENIFMDHAGFSTYESIYRAKEIFSAEKIVVITQEYHLSRALYCATELGIEAYGVPADLRRYGKETYNFLRESAARTKEFFNLLIKPEPTYLGESVSLDGNGDITNDK